MWYYDEEFKQLVKKGEGKSSSHDTFRTDGDIRIFGGCVFPILKIEPGTLLVYHNFGRTIYFQLLGSLDIRRITPKHFCGYTRLNF